MSFFSKPQEPQPPKPLIQVVREYVVAVGLAVLLATVIRGSVVMAYMIPSGSMLETLQIGDRIVVNKAAYHLRLPLTDVVLMNTGSVKRGDIVVFDHPQSHDTYIKRIIGLPGETLTIADKKVFIDGRPLDEPYIRYTDDRVLAAYVAPRDNLGPLVVPSGHLFVMGDNRDSSYDSRFWGPLAVEAVRGQAKYHLWSWDSEQFRPRWSRFFSGIH
jgi:signal peptidase I